MTTTTYVDANLHHDQVTGRAVTACLHIVDTIPFFSIPKGNQQLKLQLLALNLWQPEMLKIKSMTSGTLSCILESQSDPKATCLVMINLKLTVQVDPPPLLKHKSKSLIWPLHFLCLNTFQLQCMVATGFYHCCY